jgi:hypothetical protein
MDFVQPVMQLTFTAVFRSLHYHSEITTKTG